MRISPISPKISFKNKETDNNNKTSNKQLTNYALGCALLAFLVYIGSCNLPFKNNSQVTIPFDSKRTSISEIAKIYNINEKAIMAYNNVGDNEEIENLSELKIPQTYDYTQTRITQLQNFLHSKDLSQEKRELYETEIQMLLRKRKEQQNVANVYADDDNIYINIDIKDTASDYIQNRYALGINIESLKKLFDIKDGAIEDNNELNSQWVATNADGDKGYYDYTLNWFHNGDVIKIPKNSINTDNINLNQYIIE